MGYSSVTIQPGYHLFTATFEDCAGGEYNLNNVTVLNEDGSKWDVPDASTVACVITKMTTDGVGKYDSTKMYSYRHVVIPIPNAPIDTGLGWYTGATSTRIGNNITLKNGEGLSINNKLNVPIKLQFSGAVTLTGRSFKIGPGYSLVGNMTPVDINLNNVRVLNESGEVIDIPDASTVVCVVTKMTTDGVGKYDSTKMYSYRHVVIPIPNAPIDTGLGWYTGATSTRIGNNITIGTGEALSINNKLKYDIIVEFPSPIKKDVAE